jgi:signal transduction histidine kinase/ligand-binding sensor domain-containing protein
MNHFPCACLCRIRLVWWMSILLYRNQRLARFFCLSSRHLLVMLIGLFTYYSANAVNVPERISFKNILENKDIAMGEGVSFFQDSDGFMWLGGSNALIRYDGYEFKQIEIIETVSKSAGAARGYIAREGSDSSVVRLPIKMVQNIYEDSNGTIWFASRSGVLKYDPMTEKVIRIPDDESQPLKITASDSRRIIELPTGEILVCSISGLLVVDPKTLKYTVIVPDKDKANGLSGTRVEDVEFDDDGYIWLATDEGLERVDWKTKTFTLFKVDTEHPDLFENNRVVDIVPDEDRHFWLATGYGLVHYDTNTHEATRYLHDPNDRYSLGSNSLWDVLFDSRGVLWVASDGGGLSVFDAENNRFINHKYEAGRVGAINTNQVRSIFEDRNGDIWVGNFPVGVNFYDRSGAAITSYSRSLSNAKSLSVDHVLSTLEDDKGNFWVGTDSGGLDYFDRATGEFTHYRHVANDPTTLNGDSVLTMYEDSTGIIWVGVWGGGLASFNPADMKFTRYPFGQQRRSDEREIISDRLNSEHAWTIYEDSRYTLWIGLHKGGLSKYDRQSKQFTTYKHVPGDPESIANDLVWNTLEDSRGNFWAGTGSGLCLMDREKGTFKTYASDSKDPTTLSNSSIISIYEDSKQRLWLGTDAGLNLFHPETETFTAYTKHSGFLDDTIRTILEDASGVLWLSTNNGITAFNPETKEIKNYNRLDGRLIGGFSSRSGMVSSRGEIVFGGVNGLRIIKPNELSDNPYPPPVVFTDFKVFADSVVVGAKDGILSRSINRTDTIRLDHEKTMFVFSFAALNYRDPEKNRYSYKLEGFDTDWLDAGDQRTAKYTNLDPGKYTFRVRGSNNDGVWNKEGKSVTVIQLTAPWKTAWAYTLYFSIFLSMLFWFAFQQRRNRHLIEEQNRILELKVMERTAQVREKSKDIQIMLSNIPQGLFTVQNDGRIHPEYSQYLESIFETKDIAGRVASELLFNGANLVGDALDLAKSAIFAIIGEDEINFELNRSLLVTDYDIQIGDHRKSLSLDWSPILENDLVNRLMVSVRDVTHVKQMESNLIQSEKLAALGALVAGVAHELNTPIGNGLTVATTLREYCGTMKKLMTSGLTRTALERFVTDVDDGTLLVNRNLERASELISSFKQVAIDRTSAQRRKFSLHGFLTETCLTASPIFKRTPYVVDIQVPEDISLDSYPGPLGQVITNLLNNAVIHAFDGRDYGRVVLSTEIVLGGVNISVADDGKGISVENQAKIFDPFFTTKLGSGGNGLGMHIVHNIVTGVLGGTIQLHSQVGEGTCFVIFLPKAAPFVNATFDE